MATRQAKDAQGNIVTFRNYKDANGQEQWAKVDTPPAESPTSSFNKDRQRELLAQEGSHIPSYTSDHVKYMDRLFVERGPESPEYKRAKESEKMGFGQKFNIIAGRETDKLLSGAANIYDFLADIGGSDTAMERTLNRAKEQQYKDEIMEQIDENQGLAMLGAALPYVVTGTLTGPASRAVAAKTVSGVENAVNTTNAAARGLATRGVDKLAAGNTPVVSQLARKAKEEIMDPIKREAMRSANQIKTVDRYREGMLNNILGGGVTGSAEGSLRYGDDTNFLTGAISGTLGSVSGKALERPFRRAPVYWDAVEQAKVDWARDKGMRLLPGMTTGSKALQKFEHGLRETDQFADYLGDFDAANAAVMQREAAKAMGIDPKLKDSFSPESLSAHGKSLSDEYKYLENSSVGRFSPADYREIEAGVKALKENTTPQGKKAYKTANAYLEQLNKISRPVRNAQGRMTKQTFDGSKYQDMMQQLKSEIDSAYTRGDNLTAFGLEPLTKKLKKAMDTGVRDFGGVEGSAKWNDLNERFAITDLVMRNGMTVDNKFDAGKLASHLMTSDPKRTLMEQGGRIKDLQKLVKVDHMMKNQAGSGLSGTNTIADNSGKLSLMQRLVSGSTTGQIPIIPSAYMALYKRGIPSSRGLLSLIPSPIRIEGLTGKNAGDLAKYTRAIAQGTQGHNKAIEGAVDFLDSFREENSEGKQGELYKKLMMMTQ